MEIYYNLLGVYSPNSSDLEEARNLAEELMESSFIDRNEIIELAKSTNSVLLVEEEVDDGDMEFIVVSNKGNVRMHEIFSLDKCEKARNEVEKVGPETYFTKTMLNDIDKLAKEYEMNRYEFIHEYLSTYYMDLYENKKMKYVDNIIEYYQE